MPGPADVPALLLTSLLPGWLLVRALWPHRRVRDPMGAFSTLVLSLGFSIAIVIVVGGILGYLPHGDYGWYRPWTVVVGLLLASAGLAVWGLARGAYPRLRRAGIGGEPRGDPLAARR